MSSSWKLNIKPGDFITWFGTNKNLDEGCSRIHECVQNILHPEIPNQTDLDECQEIVKIVWSDGSETEAYYREIYKYPDGIPKEFDIRTNSPMSCITVGIVLVKAKEGVTLHPDDLEVEGVYGLIVDVDSTLLPADAGDDLVLDAFHNTYPIKVLDDFDIVVSVKPLKAIFNVLIYGLTRRPDYNPKWLELKDAEIYFNYLYRF